MVVYHNINTYTSQLVITLITLIILLNVHIYNLGQELLVAKQFNSNNLAEISNKNNLLSKINKNNSQLVTTVDQLNYELQTSGYKNIYLENVIQRYQTGNFTTVALMKVGRNYVSEICRIMYPGHTQYSRFPRIVGCGEQMRVGCSPDEWYNTAAIIYTFHPQHMIERLNKLFPIIYDCNVYMRVLDHNNITYVKC